VGHKLFGLWGMVLGVPVAVFVFRHVILGADASAVSQGDRDSDQECDHA